MINSAISQTLTPRGYQIDGINWLRKVRRGILTDWPGLGKTLQAAEAAELPCLVTVPKHLVLQWEDFLNEQYPDKIVVAAQGTRKERNELLDQKADYYIINHAMFRSYSMPAGIRTIIVDESHHFRNRNATQSLGLKAFANADITRRVYMLSATPTWKNLDDIWMQLHILHPQVFTSYHQFIKMFFVTVDNPYTTKVVAVKKAMRKVLDDTISPIKFGRTYKDVGRFLPEIIENVVTVDLTPELRKLYTDVRDTYRAQYEEEGENQKFIFKSAGILNALRQITFTQPKLEAIKEIIEDNNRPTLIGCWYRDHAEKVQNMLGKDKCILITGDLDGAERRKVAMDAQRRKLHIVATEASLTEGVNLYQYRQVIMAEEHYTPGSNYQFISRVVRDRNDNGADQAPVLVHYVHAKKTCDVHIHRVTKQRQGTMKDLMREILV